MLQAPGVEKEKMPSKDLGTVVTLSPEGFDPGLVRPSESGKAAQPT